MRVNQSVNSTREEDLMAERESTDEPTGDEFDEARKATEELREELDKEKRAHEQDIEELAREAEREARRTPPTGES